MPTYEFKCPIPDCKHEWEEVLSIKAPDPTHCPKCQAEGNITRLISGGSGKGRVELTGHELVAKVKEDTAKLKNEMYKSTNTYANILGENKYHEIQTRLDRQKR